MAVSRGQEPLRLVIFKGHASQDTSLFNAGKLIQNEHQVEQLAPFLQGED